MAKLKAKHLFDLTFVSDAQLSPDGRQVAAVQTTVYEPSDKEKPPEYRSHIFLYDVQAPAGGEGVQLTHGGESNTQPRFSPDGSRLAFVSKRGEESLPQLYLLSLSGGEGKPLTNFKAGVGEIVWSPSGEQLAFTSRGDFEDDVGKKGEGRTIDRLFYKGDGVGFRADEPEQVYLHNLETGTTDKLTKLRSSPGALTFSPDGALLYFVGAKDNDAEDAWESDLWALPITTKGKPQRLIGNLSRVFSATPSPDGTRLALLAATDQNNFASLPGSGSRPLRGVRQPCSPETSRPSPARVVTAISEGTPTHRPGPTTARACTSTRTKRGAAASPGSA